MIEVARATVTIVPNLQGAQESITQQLTQAGGSAGESAGRSAGGSFSSALGRGLAVAGVGVAAFAGAVTAGTAALSGAIAETAAYGDEIDKTAQKLGMSNQSYQEWDYVLNLAGTSMQDCTMGMKTLTNQIDAAMSGNADAIANFEALGISIDELGGMSREEAFGAVITGMQGMEDGLERAALANDLFGRSGQNLTPVFNMTAEETEGLIDRANEYGMVMSDEAIAASAAFQDSLTTLQGTITGLRNTMLSQFLPSITRVTDGLAALMAGDTSGLDEIKAGITEVTEVIGSLVPQVLDIGAGIVIALIDGLVPMLPTLIESLVGAFNTLLNALIALLPTLIPVVVDGILLIASTLINNLPLVISTAMQVVIALVQGITTALPQLIPAAVDAILTICDGLVSNLGPLLDAAIELIVSLTQGLMDALPRLAEHIPQITTTIVTTLLSHLPELVNAALQIMMALTMGMIDNIPLMIEMLPQVITAVVSTLGQIGPELASNAATWAYDMITSFVDGITNSIQRVASAASNIAGTIASYIHFSEPDVGPLSDFHTFAPDMIDLFTQGLEDGEAQVSMAMESVLALPSPDMVDASGTGAELAGAGDTALTIPVYIGQEKLDTIILKSLKTNTYRRGG